MKKLPVDVAKPKVSRRSDTKQLVTEVRVRQLAQEWVRNGMNLEAAYQTCTGRKLHEKSVAYATSGHVDTFMDEVRLCVDRSDIDKTSALNILWTVLQSSILDYFHENGRLLSMAEMKRLPRAYQQIIHKAKVFTKQVPLKDAAGNIMMDDNGRPYVIEESQVEVEVMAKLEAVKQLALIMRWVGPATVINNHNTINIGHFMVNADERVRKLDSLYESPKAIDKA